MSIVEEKINEILKLLCGRDENGHNLARLLRITEELGNESMTVINACIDGVLSHSSEHSENSKTGCIDQVRFKTLLKKFHSTYLTKGSDAKTFIQGMYQVYVDPNNPCRKTLLEFYNRSDLDDW